MYMKRDARFDFYKGLLMIGIVFGHVLNALQAGEGETFWVHQFVRTYDLPMFAFISGIFLKNSCEKRGPIKNILKKVRGVLLPAIIWSEVFALLSGRLIPLTGGLWFLYSIFIASIIIIIIDQIKNTVVQVSCFVFIILLFHTVIIDPFMTGFLLAPMVVGYYYNDILRKLKLVFNLKIRKILMIASVFTFILAQCFWKSDFSIWTQGCNLLKDGVYASNAFRIVFRFATGILGCIAMKKFFDILYLWLETDNRRECKKTIATIVLWGQNTLELYILHAWLVSVAGAKAVTYIVSQIGNNPMMFNERLLLMVIAPVITIFSIEICYIISKLVKRIPVLGKHIFSI